MGSYTVTAAWLTIKKLSSVDLLGLLIIYMCRNSNLLNHFVFRDLVCDLVCDCLVICMLVLLLDILDFFWVICRLLDSNGSMKLELPNEVVKSFFSTPVDYEIRRSEYVMTPIKNSTAILLRLIIFFQLLRYASKLSLNTSKLHTPLTQGSTK